MYIREVKSMGDSEKNKMTLFKWKIQTRKEKTSEAEILKNI